MDCAIKSVHSNRRLLHVFNHGFHRHQKNGHVSHMTHAIPPRLAARRPASSPSGAHKNKVPATQFRRHSHSVCTVSVRLRTCLMAHASKHTHGASCVEPNDSLCAVLQRLTLVPSALPCLAPLTMNTTHHFVIEKTETYSFWHPGAPLVTAIRRLEGP